MSAIFDPLCGITGRRVGYARVSTPEQKTRSQCDWLQAAECERIFVDHGVSGAQASRPALDEMLEYLQEGDAVLVWRLDRLGRSVAHLAELLTRFERDGIHFYSAHEGINTTSAMGKCMFHISAAYAEMNRTLIIENTLAGLEAARARGVRIGRPPALTYQKALKASETLSEGKITRDQLARRLKVSRATLDRTLRRYGLDPV